MPKCKLKRTCGEMRRLLRRMGVAKDQIVTECNGHQPCDGALDNLYNAINHLNIDNANTVHVFFRKLFGSLPVDKSSVALTQLFKKQPFYCGELSAEVLQPCRADTCAYWTDNPWTRNCIMFYLLDQGRESLDVKDLTFLLGKPSAELRHRLHGIVIQMRHIALKHKTAQAEDQIPIRIVDAERCMACGAALEDKVVLRQGHQYCSAECIEKKPPLELRIEQEFRLSVDRVLQICIDSFGARRPMCHALSVTGRQLDDLCCRHQIDTSHLQ